MQERVVELTSDRSLVARGSLIGWDYELQAQRAVAEEEDELARMRAELAPRDHQLQISDVATAQDQERQTLMMRVQEGLSNVDLLARDRAELLAKVMQQAEQLGQARAEVEALRRRSTAARTVMVDILGSRGYCMMRVLGRWRAIERGIQRALREP